MKQGEASHERLIIPNNWFDEGFPKLMKMVSQYSGVPIDTVHNVYGAMDHFNLTDYDIEKDAVSFIIYGQER